MVAMIQEFQEFKEWHGTRHQPWHPSWAVALGMVRGTRHGHRLPPRTIRGQHMPSWIGATATGSGRPDSGRVANQWSSQIWWELHMLNAVLLEAVNPFLDVV
jgi:hypothetical protein